MPDDSLPAQVRTALASVRNASEVTLCEMTYQQATNRGACPVHGGDACLVVFAPVGPLLNDVAARVAAMLERLERHRSPEAFDRLEFLDLGLRALRGEP